MPSSAAGQGMPRVRCLTCGPGHRPSNSPCGGRECDDATFRPNRFLWRRTLSSGAVKVRAVTAGHRAQRKAAQDGQSTAQLALVRGKRLAARRPLRCSCPSSEAAGSDVASQTLRAFDITYGTFDNVFARKPVGGGRFRGPARGRRTATFPHFRHAGDVVRPAT